MKPLKMMPAYKDYIWGGTKLKSKYQKKSNFDKVAESWELSCHPDGESVIEGENKTLSQYIKNNQAVLGTRNKTGELPILIKLIDAADNLSVQVHPSDAEAKLWENQNGKTEMWYVLEAEENAQIIYGVKQDITKQELEKAILENRATDLLCSVASEKGQVFFVDAGTIHAIGKGNLIVEIQQNSNVTYRLYDYGRVDKSGKPRELHIEKGIQCATTEKIKRRAIPICSDGCQMLGSCAYFQTKKFEINGKRDFYADEKSYHAVVNISGDLTVRYRDEQIPFALGETFFIPADLGSYEICGNGSILFVTNTPDYHISIVREGNSVAATVIDSYGISYGKAVMQVCNDDISGTIISCAKAAAEHSGIDYEEIQGIEKS